MTELAMRECPRFSHCCMNKCPLNTSYNSLQTYPDDNMLKCGMNKRRRKTIAKKFGLKNGGLTTREQKSNAYWTNMDPAEKERRIQKLRESSPLLKLKAKGYAITRTSKPDLKFTQDNSPEMPTIKEFEGVSA